MKFLINSPDGLKITYDEISDLLSQVYVDGGFTSPDSAISVFEPVSVSIR